MWWRKGQLFSVVANPSVMPSAWRTARYLSFIVRVNPNVKVFSSLQHKPLFQRFSLMRVFHSKITSVKSNILVACFRGRSKVKVSYRTAAQELVCTEKRVQASLNFSTFHVSCSFMCWVAERREQVWGRQREVHKKVSNVFQLHLSPYTSRSSRKVMSPAPC